MLESREAHRALAVAPCDLEQRLAHRTTPDRCGHLERGLARPGRRRNHEGSEGGGRRGRGGGDLDGSHEQGHGVQLQLSQLIEDPDAIGVLERVAREMEADLVVVGSHGRTGWRERILGNVATKLPHALDCPITIVPAPKVPRA